MSAVASSGHFARIPSEVIMSSISPRSLSVYNLMALYASREKPEIWVRQATFAEKLKCSTDTIYRGIKELAKFGLVAELKRPHRGLYKRYRLQWFFKDSPAETLNSDTMRTSAQTYRKDAVPHTAPVREDIPQICGPINRVSTQNRTEHFFSERAQEPSVGKSEVELLLQTYGEDWKKRFPCLDGLSGRPSLKECVEQGLAHKARKNYADIKIYLDTWVRNASQKWIFLYNKEQNASPTDSALDSGAQKRRAEAERLNQLELAQKKAESAKKRQEEAEQIKNTQQAEPQTPETEEERAWIVARIKADIEAEQRKAGKEKSRKPVSAWLNRNKTPAADESKREISKENYPMRWDYQRQLWARSHASTSEVSNG